MARQKAFDKNEALDKAMKAFWARGYEATSVQDLVDCMGINRGSLYNTFGDKHKLFLAALDRYGKNSTSLRTERLSKPGNARTMLSEFMYDFIYALISDKERRGCFMTNSAVELSPHDDDCAVQIRAFFEQTERALQNLIRRGQQEGTITSARSAGDLATFLVGVMQGIRVVGKVNPDDSQLRPLADVALSTLDH